jgi:hypothetical protein
MAVNTAEKKEDKTKELEQWLQMTSPFAIHEGEILVNEKAEEYGHYIELDPFQTEIVKSVNALLFATRQLVKKYLIRQGVKVKDKLLDKQLKRLSYNNYLRKMGCVSPDGTQSVAKIYTLDRKGKGFLRYMGVKVRLEGYVNDRIRTPGQVKKILAANQAMLAIAGSNKEIYIETAKMYIVNEKHPRNRLFRALGFVNATGNDSYFIQPVRNEKDNVTDLLDKLYRMEKVIKKVGFSDLKIEKNLTVIVVAENKVWMEYLKNLLEKKHYTHFKLAITYDRLIVSDLPLDKKIDSIRTTSFVQKVLSIA